MHAIGTAERMPLDEGGGRLKARPPTNAMRVRFLVFALAALLLVSPLRAHAEPSDVDAEPSPAYVEGLLRAFAEQKTAPGTPITLQDAVTTAVANNPDVLAGKRNPESAAYDVLGAEAVYEPKVRVDFSYGNRKVPTSDVLQGAGLGDPLKDDEYLADVTLSKTLKTGTALELLWRNSRRTTNSSFQQLSPSYQPSVGVGIQQPLLQDFGGLAARTSVALAENTSFRSAAIYETELARFVLAVVDAYWRYNLAQAELAAKQRSLELASSLAKEARARVEIGSLPPVAAKEAESDAAARDEEVISASNDLSLSARELQYRVMLGGNTSGAPTSVRPAEVHLVEPVPLDPAASLTRAIRQRPEARSARLEIASANLDRRLARNLLLPSLDFVGRYDLVGLGGLGNPDFQPPPGTSGRSETDAFGDSYDVLDSTDFFRYRVGVELEVPLSNAEARSRHAKADIALRRAEDRLRAIVSDIALEIQQAVGDVASAEKRVAAARLARELAEQNLVDQQKRYNVGIVTTTDILDFQDKATNAMATEAQAVADHAIAVAELERAEGSLLQSYGVRVEFADAPGKEWWSRF